MGFVLADRVMGYYEVPYHPALMRVPKWVRKA
jgi:hypothetical protein